MFECPGQETTTCSGGHCSRVRGLCTAPSRSAHVDHRVTFEHLHCFQTDALRRLVLGRLLDGTYTRMPLPEQLPHFELGRSFGLRHSLQTLFWLPCGHTPRLQSLQSFSFRFFPCRHTPCLNFPCTKLASRVPFVTIGSLAAITTWSCGRSRFLLRAAGLWQVSVTGWGEELFTRSNWRLLCFSLSRSRQSERKTSFASSGSHLSSERCPICTTSGWHMIRGGFDCSDTAGSHLAQSLVRSFLELGIAPTARAVT